MPAMLLPLAMLVAPFPSGERPEGQRGRLDFALVSSVRAHLTAHLAPMDEFRLPSRIAWTVDVGGQPITLVPLRPSGGFQLNVEMTF